VLVFYSCPRLYRSASFKQHYWWR